MKYTLTDQEQTIVTLREEQQLSFRAIGERLELSPSKASYAYHRAARRAGADRPDRRGKAGQGGAVKFPLPFWGGSWYNKENTP